MSLGDWLGITGLAVGVLGLVVAALGFGLTIQQLRRTATASEATVTALADAARQMNKNYLLVLLPQLESAEANLDVAVDRDDRTLAIRTLVTYAHTASRVSNLLRALNDEADAQLIELLANSSESATRAKSTLVTAKARSMRVVVKEPLEQITAVSAHAAGLTTRFQTKVGEPNA